MITDIKSHKSQRNGRTHMANDFVKEPDNIVTTFFEKMQLTGLVKDHEDKYSFVFDDKVGVDIFLERRYVFFDTLIAQLPIKMMTKERVLTDLAKHTLFDIKEHDVCFYIDKTQQTIHGYLRHDINGLDESIFESVLGQFVDVIETYQEYIEKILRMGELSDIPVEFRLD